VTASDATQEYVDFLLSTADSESNRPDGKISLICAAMAPCMRLYAFLGQRLADSGFGRPADAAAAGAADAAGSPLSDPRGEYAAWVETYRAAEFEALAASLEALLDRYAAEEQADPAQLGAAYARAMALERAFFSAQPGLDGATAPWLGARVLAVDFDQTVTEGDTSGREQRVTDSSNGLQ
jgi:thiaminase/transcriptional activator TenA